LWVGWEIARCCGVCDKESTRMMRTSFIKKFRETSEVVTSFSYHIHSINIQSRMN